MDNLHAVLIAVATVIDVTVLPRLATALTALTLSVLFAGCTAAAEPTPTPTPAPTFTEEEAFALAEETFREYYEVLRSFDYSDAEAFEEIAAFTTRRYYLGERKGLMNSHLDGNRVIGKRSLIKLLQHNIDSDMTVQLVACEDLSEVDVVDADGKSLVSPTRPDVIARIITFELVNERFVISNAEGGPNDQCSQLQ